MMSEEGFLTPDPRKIFIRDLIDIIKELDESKNSHTILMLDANENINDSEGGISYLIRETTLVDVFSEIGNDECSLPTYTRGSKKIDYICWNISTH
jgi:hypothetical protein